MKKTLFSTIFVLTFFGYAYYKPHFDAFLVSLSQPAAIASTQYRDGNYMGSSSNAYYGAIKVAVAVQNGRIADVTFLEYPKNAQNSVRLNEDAIPKLKSETLIAQNAQVDGVTGASLTSAAYIESLSSALAQAAL